MLLREWKWTSTCINADCWLYVNFTCCLLHPASKLKSSSLRTVESSTDPYLDLEHSLANSSNTTSNNKRNGNMSQSRELLHLYRRLLRSCATYPSKNRWGIYKAIQEEFRDNINLNPEDPKTQKQISIAYKGLSQLRMYDAMNLSKGNPDNPNWEVTLEQNPMPKPDGG